MPLSSNAKESNDELVVLGCGLPRTGTTSLKTALEELLNGQCYHMFSFIHDGDDKDMEMWTKAMDGKATKKDWRNFFKSKGFIACVDFPGAFFYKEILEAFPKAKVILTTRNPSSWHDSVLDTIFGTFKNLETFPSSILLSLDKKMAAKLKLAKKCSTARPSGLGTSMFEAIEAGKLESVDFVKYWEESVRRNVPKDQLLEFDVKQGWQPLCDFLGVPAPGKPFPRVNDREQMKKNISKVRTVAWGVVLGFPAILSAIIYGALWSLDYV